jgi:hypothetical protein
MHEPAAMLIGPNTCLLVAFLIWVALEDQQLNSHGIFRMVLAFIRIWRRSISGLVRQDGALRCHGSGEVAIRQLTEGHQWREPNFRHVCGAGNAGRRVAAGHILKAFASGI